MQMSVGEFSFRGFGTLLGIAAIVALSSRTLFTADILARTYFSANWVMNPPLVPISPGAGIYGGIGLSDRLDFLVGLDGVATYLSGAPVPAQRYFANLRTEYSPFDGVPIYGGLGVGALIVSREPNLQLADATSFKDGTFFALKPVIGARLAMGYGFSLMLEGQLTEVFFYSGVQGQSPGLHAGFSLGVEKRF